MYRSGLFWGGIYFVFQAQNIYFLNWKKYDIIIVIEEYVSKNEGENRYYGGTPSVNIH